MENDTNNNVELNNSETKVPDKKNKPIKFLPVFLIAIAGTFLLDFVYFLIFCLGSMNIYKNNQEINDPVLPKYENKYEEKPKENTENKKEDKEEVVEKKEEKPVEDVTKDKDDKEEEETKICVFNSPSKNNGLNDFDIKFMQLENEEKNLVYSPISIKYALAMLSDGANGETKKQIDNVLGNYQATKYQNCKHLAFANALFVKSSKNFSIKDYYKNRLTSYYGAEVIPDSFQSDDNIRKWIKENTLGMIDTKIPVDDETMYALVNALAINMNWKNQLQCADTDSNVPCELYWVKYKHENYSEMIMPIESEKYFPKMTFNGKTNRRSTEIGATINNYDVIKTLGEKNIRELLSKEYDQLVEKYGKDEYENTCVSKEEAIEEHLSSVKKNYHDVQESTDFYIYDDSNIKMFAKDLKEYDCLNLQYVAIMPKNTSIKNYVDKLTAEELRNNIKKLKEIKYENFEEGYITKITGNIPLFKYDSSLQLIEDLNKLNVTDVFDSEKSDLSNISDVPSYIETAIHEAIIEFSNDGIRAAAFTEGGGGAGDVTSICLNHVFNIPVKTIDISFDNPFMFIIRDKNTGEIWFAGKVYDVIEQK